MEACRIRGAGVLLPVSALPSPYGIGTLGNAAYRFIDQLHAAGQTYWQVLPIGPTGFGNSPYQSYSAFAGNPYFIDLDRLAEQGLLTQNDILKFDWGENRSCISYDKIAEHRFQLLQTAYENSNHLYRSDYMEFCKKQEHWLDDYALFMALKDANHGKSWSEWEEGIRNRRPEALEEAGQKYKTDIGFYEFVQYEFFRQWDALKKYANEQGIQIIGDIPIYVAFDSADTWSDTKQFQLDEDNLPVAVAGCPPDGFSADGQLWGNPLYDWEYHKKTGYAWWMRRIAHCFALYDIVRIDHFRGFDEYYAIPYGEKTARNGKWQQGPGMDLFGAVREQFGDLPIIAEDLGFLTDSVRRMLKESGYPGMKVLQFAFDSREESDYLPHNYERNCVVYTGTHDNNTVMGWYDELAPEDKKLAVDYLHNAYTPKKEIYWDYIALAMRSVADTCIIPVQDYLGLGKEARINTPSTLGGNWVYRLPKKTFDAAKIRKIRRMTEICARLPKVQKEAEEEKETEVTTDTKER